MQGLVSFVAINLGEIESSLTDPLLLFCLVVALFSALSLGLTRGMVVMLLMAIGRMVVTDWQHFAPGVPPSAELIYVFTSTLLSVLVVFLIVKLVRTLWRRTRFRLAW